MQLRMLVARYIKDGTSQAIDHPTKIHPTTFIHQGTMAGGFLFKGVHMYMYMYVYMYMYMYVGKLENSPPKDQLASKSQSGS